jgi:hypothetical protein
MSAAEETTVQRDVVDLLFVLTSFAVYDQLAAGRTREETCRLIQATTADVANAASARLRR